jgi:hypothetical protein
MWVQQRKGPEIWLYQLWQPPKRVNKIGKSILEIAAKYRSILLGMTVTENLTLASVSKIYCNPVVQSYYLHCPFVVDVRLMCYLLGYLHVIVASIPSLFCLLQSRWQASCFHALSQNKSCYYNNYSLIIKNGNWTWLIYRWVTY